MARDGRFARRARRLLAALLLAGCSTPGPPAAWRVQDIAGASSSVIGLQNDDGKTVAVVSARQIRDLQETKIRIDEAAGVSPDLLLVEGKEPNAFAGKGSGRDMIAVNLGMLRLLDRDKDAFAFLLGHEAAHLARKHGETRESRSESLQGIGMVLSFALSAAGIPASGALTDIGTTVVERSYTRDEEREADALGVEYMIQAGFDPEGAVRMQEKLLAASGTSALPFLSTHPTGQERIDNLRRLINDRQR